MAVLLNDGAKDKTFYFGIIRRKNKFQFKRKFSVIEKYKNGKGNWCMVWNVGDAGYIYDDTSEGSPPIGLLVKISNMEKNKFRSGSDEMLLNSWGSKFNEYKRAHPVHLPVNVGTGKRSKGCYFSVTPADSISLESDMYTLLHNSMWGIYDNNWFFNTIYFPSHGSLYKLNWDSDSMKFHTISTEYYVQKRYDRRVFIDGESIVLNAPLFMDINACDPRFINSTAIYHQSEYDTTESIVGSATPLSDAEARNRHFG